MLLWKWPIQLCGKYVEACMSMNLYIRWSFMCKNAHTTWQMTTIIWCVCTETSWQIHWSGMVGVVKATFSVFISQLLQLLKRACTQVTYRQPTSWMQSNILSGSVKGTFQLIATTYCWSAARMCARRLVILTKGHAVLQGLVRCSKPAVGWIQSLDNLSVLTQSWRVTIDERTVYVWFHLIHERQLLIGVPYHLQLKPLVLSIMQTASNTSHIWKDWLLNWLVQCSLCHPIPINNNSDNNIKWFVLSVWGFLQ